MAGETFKYNVVVPGIKGLNKDLTKAEQSLIKIKEQLKAIASTKGGNTSAEFQKLSQEARTLKVAINELTKANQARIKTFLKDGRKTQQTSLNFLSKSIQKLTADYRKLTQAERNSAKGRDIINKLKQVTKESNKAEKALRKATGRVSSMGKAFRLVGGVLASAGIFLSIRSITQGLVKMTDSFVKFTREMSVLQEVTGASTTELIKLEASARQLGETTDFTAIQVAELQVAFARLGFTSSEVLNATAAALDVATISGEDLGKTAEVLASTIRAFNLDATEAERVGNIMAKSFSSSALTLEKFKVAMAISAPVAESFGFSLELTTAIIGKMVDRSIDASTVGTSLRNIFITLQKDGISYNDALELITKSSNKAATAFDLFGKRGLTVALILAQAQEEVNELSDALIDSTNFASLAAGRIRGDLQGSIDKLNSAMQGLTLNIVQKYAPALQSVIDALTNIAIAANEDFSNKPSVAFEAQANTANAYTLVLEGLIARGKDVTGTITDIVSNFPKLGKEFVDAGNDVNFLIKGLKTLNETSTIRAKIAKQNEKIEFINKRIAISQDKVNKELLAGGLAQDGLAVKINKVISGSNAFKSALSGNSTSAQDLAMQTEELGVELDELDNLYSELEESGSGYSDLLIELRDNQKKVTDSTKKLVFEDLLLFEAFKKEAVSIAANTESLDASEVAAYVAGLTPTEGNLTRISNFVAQIRALSAEVEKGGESTEKYVKGLGAFDRLTGHLGFATKELKDEFARLVRDGIIPNKENIAALGKETAEYIEQLELIEQLIKNAQGLSDSELLGLAQIQVATQGLEKLAELYKNFTGDTGELTKLVDAQTLEQDGIELNAKLLELNAKLKDTLVIFGEDRLDIANEIADVELEIVKNGVDKQIATIEAARTSGDDEIEEIKKVELAKLAVIEAAEEARLKGFKGSSEELSRIQAIFTNRRSVVIKQAALEELLVAQVATQAVAALGEDVGTKLEELIEQIAKLKKELATLGVVTTEEEPEDTSEEKFKRIAAKVANVARELNKLFSEINDAQSEAIDRNLDRELKAIDAQFQARIDAAAGDKELQKQIKKEQAQAEEVAQRKAFERQKAIDIQTAIAAGAMAILNSARVGFPLAFVTMGVAAVTTAIQIAKIKASTFPGFAEGGFTGPGKQKDSTGRKVAGVVHENEYVAPTSQIERHPDVFRFLEADRMAMHRKFAAGGFTSNIPQLINPSSLSSGNVSATISQDQMAALIDQMSVAVENGSRRGSSLGAVDRKREIEREENFQINTQF